MSTLIRRGDRGPAVAEVRARLARLGLLPGSRVAELESERDRLRSGPLEQVTEPADWETTQLISADFDDAVEFAVRRFQQERGITVDGIVGPETFRRLEEARWQLGDRVLSFAADRPTIGEDVHELQNRLNAMGFSCGREDGEFGPYTDQALRDFQHNVGLKVDGICGPATFRGFGQLRRTVGGSESSHSVRERASLQQMKTGVAGKIVVLDPAPLQLQYIDECTEISRDLAARVERRLGPQGARTATTGPTVHTEDSEVERARFCNELEADLVLSITLFSLIDQPQGISAYHYGRDSGSLSVPGHMLAGMILDGMSQSLPNVSAEPGARTWDILRRTRMPTVRLVCGNISAQQDREQLSDPAVLDGIADAVAEAVVAFFSPS